jgi:hypothetical protein
MKVIMLSALRTGCLNPTPEDIHGNFCYRLSGPQGHSAAGRIRSMKNPNDSTGIEPATYRLVARAQSSCRVFDKYSHPVRRHIFLEQLLHGVHSFAKIVLGLGHESVKF